MRPCLLPCLPVLAVTLALAVAAPPATAAAAPRGQRAVIVYLKDAFDPFTLRLAPDRSNRAAILEAMQRNLEQSRRPVAAVLDGSAGAVSRVVWIRCANGAAVTADAAVVRRLEGHPAVRRVLPDAPAYAPRTFAARGRAAPVGPFAEGLPQIKSVDVAAQLGLTGAGVRVGHIDTGADGSHPDLAGKIAAFRDFCQPSNTTPVDSDTHGTHTAGTVCGGATGGCQIGVAPDARLVVALAIGNGSATSTLLKAMDWMCDPDGVPATDDAPRVVTCSWHSGNADTTPFFEAITAWLNLGIFPNFSAGNSGPGASTITHPKEFPGCFAAAAVDFHDVVTDFSSRGPAMYLGQSVPKPDAAAPGDEVWSARPGGGWTRKSGTSMAAPHVAGVVALMVQANPGLLPDDIHRVLRETADDLGAPGHDTTYGAGRVNALRAVQAVASGARVAGAIRDLSSGSPLPGTVSVSGSPIVAPADPATGRFRLFLPAGTYVLTARCFSYLEAQQTLTVAAGDEPEVAFDLARAPCLPVTGTVTASGPGGAPLAARVSVLDTPLPPVATDPATGRFAVDLPPGSYRFRVFSFGFRPATLGPLAVAAPGAVVDAALEALPPVLLVDDDKKASFETYYRAALQAAGVAFDERVADGPAPLQADEVLGYDVVVWFTGDASSDTLKDGDRKLLAAFSDAGGGLLVSGQDIGYELKAAPFLKDVLGARYVKDTASTQQVEGEGLSFAIRGPGGADNQRYPDVLEPAPGTAATLLYRYKGGEGAGLRFVRAHGRVVYLGFGLEGATTAEARAAVVAKALAFLRPGPEDLVRRLALLPVELRQPWLEQVLLPRLGSDGLRRAADRAGVASSLRALTVVGRTPGAP